MSLYKRGDVWWYDFTVNGRRYRASTEQLSKTAARKVEERERERRALGRTYEAVPTLKQAAAQWFRSRAEGRKSVVTVAQRVKIMLALVGPEKLVTEIGTADVEDAIQKRRLQTTKQGKAPTNATVNRDIVDTTLRPILRYCREVLELPVRDIAWQSVKLPEPRERDRKLTESEIAAWRAKLPEHHQPLFDFYARYGVRLKEAFFPPENYDPATGRIFVRLRKNGKPHTIRLLPEDRAAMTARYGRAIEAELETVWFREGKNGLEPIHPRGFQAASRKALDAAQVTGVRPAHELRHHAGNELQRLTGGNLAAVQRLLGHENIASTMRYLHADDADVFDALRHAYDTSEASAATETNENNEIGDEKTGT